MSSISNHCYIINGSSNRPIAMDLTLPEHHTDTLVVFCHGFKGFKDWGPFPLVAQRMAESGLAFAKFNFSHNGTTPEHMKEFVDLEAFGNNNYQKELEDLQSVLSFFKTSPFSFKRFCLIGHSRGGSIALLYASRFPIDRLATWSSPCDLARHWDKDFLAKAKKDGVVWVANKRTQQQMPLYYQFFSNYEKHKSDLSLELNAPLVSCPTLIIHGSRDEVVPLYDAESLHNMISPSLLDIITDATHTFGGSEPWSMNTLPDDLDEVVHKTMAFFKI